MQSSPCLECYLKDKDKRNPACEACQIRKDYVKSLGGPAESVPVEMTDMGSKKTRMTWTDAAVDFMKANINVMTNKQMAAHFGVAGAAIAYQLSIRKIKRNGDFKHGVLLKDDEPDSEDLFPGKKYFTIIDFSQHGDLYDRFLSFAKEKYRTPENQILYLISQAMQ